jgi:transposase
MKGEVHVFGALNNKNGKVMTLRADKINRFSFLKFLKKLMHYHKRVFLIVDNASWHKTKEIKEFLFENYRRLRIAYFPPYSPEYNPSEYCWKAVRRDLITTKLFLSTESMGEQIQDYFRKKSFFGLKLERYLSP